METTVILLGFFKNPLSWTRKHFALLGLISPPLRMVEDELVVFLQLLEDISKPGIKSSIIPHITDKKTDTKGWQKGKGGLKMLETKPRGFLWGKCEDQLESNLISSGTALAT